MSAKIEMAVNKLDLAKWLIAALIFVAALILNYFFSKIPLPVRMIAWIVVFSGLLGLVAWTRQGMAAIEFLGEARMELRKVVWPTSQETIQTTGLIILMVVIFGFVMWAFDGLLLYLVGLLTG